MIYRVDSGHLLAPSDDAITLYEAAEMLTHYHAAVDRLEAEITRLKAELAKERECVDWYADPSNWWEEDNIMPEDCDKNGGKRARARQAERGKE